MTNRRAWAGDEWQGFALRLIQLRHKPQNVQIVPDKVKGDAGIECFSTDGCLYQCYAPEETADVKKAASAMKNKARVDLNKLVKNQNTIQQILSELNAKRWILLCPFLDDKDVVAYVRQLGNRIRDQRLSFVAGDFEALVQSQDDFSCELEQLRMASLGPPINIPAPPSEAIEAAKAGLVGERLSAKLVRAFGASISSEELDKRRREYVRAHLHRENTLDVLKRDHPVLWERSVQCLAAEENRLVALGSTMPIPGQQLSSSIDRIEASLRKDLPDLQISIITQIAVGTVSDWLVRCPLDFPDSKVSE